MKVSIRNKLLLTFCTLIFLVSAGQIIFNIFFAKSFFMHQQKSLIEESFYQIREVFNEDLTEVNTLEEKLQDTYGIKLVLATDGDIFYSSGYTSFKQSHENFERNILLEDMVFSYTPTTTIVNMHNISDGTVMLQLRGKFNYNYKDILVLMTLPMETIDNSVAFFTKTSIYITGTVLLIGIMAAIFVSKNLAAPIAMIDKVSKKIAMLNFSYMADESVSTKELSSLACSINSMSQKLQSTMSELQDANAALKKDIDYQKQMEQLRRNFIASVSHEMKTPLSLLQIYTENLKNNVSDIDREYYYDTILEETEKLSEMVSHMLEISSIDSGFVQMKLEEFSLTELCERILQQYSPIFERYRFEIKLYEGIKVSGDVKYLEQAMKNLLNNAVQYTAEGGNIKVTLEAINGQAVFSVYNQGEHIPEEDITHIWDAFYRADKSRTRTIYHNIGLGLYIVKTVMDKHEGTYCIKNVVDGVCASISLKSIE